MIGRLRFSVSQLALLFAAAFLVLVSSSKRLSMNDLGIFLAQGREMATSGGWADVDRFSHTVAGRSFLNGTWGAQAAFYHLWEWAGVDGMQALLALSVGATVVLVGAGARAVSGNPNAAGLGGMLGALLVVQNLGLRPQMFSLPLFALYGYMALSRRPTAVTVALSVAIVALWANLHGSFILAPILSGSIAAGLAWQGDERGAVRGHALTAAAALAAASINPYGIRIYRYVLENSSSPAGRGLTEWMPTSIGEPAGVRLAAAFALVGFALWRAGKLPARRDAPALIAFTLLSLTAVRHVVWMGILLPIVAARVFPPAEPDTGRAPPSGTAMVTGLHPAFGVGAILFWLAIIGSQSPAVTARGLRGDALIESRFVEGTPVQLAAWAAANGVKGNLYNPMEWGSWLAWRLPADAKLFVDVRIWIYPDEVWNDYLAVARPRREWEAILERYQIDFAILDRRFHRSLIPHMETSDRWREIYADELGVIFQHHRGPGSPPGEREGGDDATVNGL